jgi:hypothetical protein
MRQQHRISSQSTSFDRKKYRFKASFSRVYSLVASVIISFYLAAEIILQTISSAPAKDVPLLILSYLLFALLIIPVVAFVLIRSIKIIFDEAGIVRTSAWHRPIHIDWDEIISAKPDLFISGNILIIKSAISKRKTIELSPWLYDLSSILVIVREYAGSEHPLTIALEKEVLLPRQNPARMLWPIIIGIVIILSIWLIGGNLYADYREQPLNQAIANYVRQHPKTPPNQAAIDLQASMAKLGISLVNFSDGSKATAKPDKLATEEWKAITPILDEYVNKQLDKTEDSILPPPAKLHAYLDSHQADIAAIQGQLLGSSLPSWGSDSAWVERSDPKAGDSLYAGLSYYPNILQVSKLLIADIFDTQQSSGLERLQQLKAIENLSRSFQQQSTLFEQLLARISERYINKLFRHLDFVPVGWQENLGSSGRSEMMQVGIEHELLHNNRIIQDPKILNIYLAASTENRYKSPFIFLIKYHHIAHPYTRLMAVDYYQKSKENLSFWMTQNICQTSKDGYTRDSDNFIDIQEIPRQYVKLKTSDLDRELTTSIRQIKSQIRSGKSIDKIADEFKSSSQACPGEQWLAKGKDGSVAISLSHSPNWKALGMDEKLNLDRFTYKINAKNIKPVL